MLADGDLKPPQWDVQGREVDAYTFVFPVVLHCHRQLINWRSGNMDMFLSPFWMLQARADRRGREAGLWSMRLKILPFARSLWYVYCHTWYQQWLTFGC